tara:strand:- start:426 stop:632 length:207 start_codon:yes stop_codon:yes gene_type:complete
MKYDINELSSKLHKVENELKKIEREEIINKYGTFFDSKQEVLQLYMLFMFFGVHCDVIRELPTDYDVD